MVQLTGDGRGGQHPGYVLGYFDAPAAGPLEHNVHVWLNSNEILGFNTASLAPAANYYRKQRAMEFTGPGIVVDWLEIEGPLHTVWPPDSHRLIFGDLPLREFRSEQSPDVRAPARIRPRQLGTGGIVRIRNPACGQSAVMLLWKTPIVCYLSFCQNCFVGL